MNLIQKHIEKINQLCKTNKVKFLFAFGSVTNQHFNEKSDIDLIVEIDKKNPLTYADYYFNLKFALEDLFKRPIDLLEEKAIKNINFKQELVNTKIQIYG